jgi:hypothetical protein
MVILARIVFKIFGHLPLNVSGDEVVVRAVFSPYHYDARRKTLKIAAFDPTPGTDEISVMRSSFLGPDRCRKQAKTMEKPNAQPPKTFQGFAVFSVATVRDKSLSVVDSREHFLGHADIKTGCRSPSKGEPRDPIVLARSRDIGDDLLKLTKYYPELVPQADRWMGGKLSPI